MNSEVSLASQTQAVPHMGFPHNIPVRRAITVINAPNGAMLLATEKATFDLHTIPMIEAKPIAA